MAVKKRGTMGTALPVRDARRVWRAKSAGAVTKYFTKTPVTTGFAVACPRYRLWREHVVDFGHRVVFLDQGQDELDPIDAALAALPYDDEPLSAEEIAADKAGFRDYVMGESLEFEEAFRRIRALREANNRPMA